MSDGFHLLLLLERGQLPRNADGFVAAVQRYLDEMAREAAKAGLAAEDVNAAGFALCAAVDEAILAQPSSLQASWQRAPLQLRLFSGNLGGEQFFDRLQSLRDQGAIRLPSLEVYHFCLLMGFQGRYRLEGLEKLAYLTARLGDEIVYLRGVHHPFAPHALPPDAIRHPIPRVVPLWLPAVLVAAVGFAGFLGLRAGLAHQTRQQLSAYHDVVQMPERSAHISITLP